MKFALGAAAAITGASALIYLLLRPRKRQLDPGKQRATPACLTSSKDNYSGRDIQVSEENTGKNETESRESDQDRVNSDNNEFQTFNGHVAAEDKSFNFGHEDAECKISSTEQNQGVVGIDISKEVAFPADCKTENVNSNVPFYSDDKPCSAVQANSNDEVSTAVQNTSMECTAPVAEQASEEALQSINHTDVQEGIISSTAGCDISECVSVVLDSEPTGSNLNCDSNANDSCVTSSSFSEEKECEPVVNDLMNTSYSSSLKDESQQGIDFPLENEPVSSSSVEENECATVIIESCIEENFSSNGQLSASEDLQKLEYENVETIPSGEECKVSDEMSQNEVPAESFTEDSTSTKSSLTGKFDQHEADSLATELPVREVSEITGLALDTHCEEFLESEFSGEPVESVASESSENVEEEIKARALIATAKSVESSDINNVHSETEVSSKFEELQAESAEASADVSPVQSSSHSQDSEGIASEDLVTNTVSKVEPAIDIKSESMWSECVDNSSRNSVTEEAFSVFPTGGEIVTSGDDNTEKNTIVNNVELGKNDEAHVDHQTSSKTDETSAMSNEQEPIPPAAYEGSSSLLDKSKSTCVSLSSSSLEKGGSEETETGNTQGDSIPSFEIQEKLAVTLNSSEPDSVVSKESSPTTTSSSQRKKSYRDRVRNSHGSTSSAASDSIDKERVIEGDNCSNLDQSEKELSCVMEDTIDGSVSSFVVKEKAAIASGSNADEAASSSPLVKEIVIVDNKVSTPSGKKESGQNKVSKAKKEGVPKSSENSRNRSYKERVRNSIENSVSVTVQNSQDEDANSDNNGRNLKSTESSQSSGSDVGPETMFNPSAFPVNNQVQYIFYEFEIPQILVGRLIGRKGAFVNKIKAATDATIIVGPHKNRKYKICSVEGSREQVNLALDMIREYFPVSRYPDLSLEQVFNRSPAAAPPVDAQINTPAMQIELAAGVVVEVRVSAVVSGNELWVQQPLHPSYSALQRLQSCMNINYGDGSTTPPLAPHIGEGIICVAQINSQWYRCQVLSASEDFAVVVLLDVGGTVSVPALELRQIRRDYMTLPFQAAQCLLHGIQPVSEEGWDEASAVVLEELVSGAILFATVVSYTQDGVPLVNLYRREQDEYVYLNERLVNLGNAQWIAPSQAS